MELKKCIKGLTARTFSIQYFKIFGIWCFVQVRCCDTFLVLKYWTNPGAAFKECRHLLNTHKIIAFSYTFLPAL